MMHHVALFLVVEVVRCTLLSMLSVIRDTPTTPRAKHLDVSIPANSLPLAYRKTRAQHVLRYFVISEEGLAWSRVVS